MRVTTGVPNNMCCAVQVAHLARNDPDRVWGTDSQGEGRHACRSESSAGGRSDSAASRVARAMGDSTGTAKVPVLPSTSARSQGSTSGSAFFLCAPHSAALPQRSLSPPIRGFAHAPSLRTTGGQMWKGQGAAYNVAW